MKALLAIPLTREKPHPSVPLSREKPYPLLPLTLESPHPPLQITSKDTTPSSTKTRLHTTHSVKKWPHQPISPTRGRLHPPFLPTRECSIYYSFQQEKAPPTTPSDRGDSLPNTHSVNGIKIKVPSVDLVKATGSPDKRHKQSLLGGEGGGGDKAARG